MVWKELREDLIFTDVEAKTYEDVMDYVGSAFVKEGLCKESYVEALKIREDEYPTGLDLDGLGVAIPHTDVSHVNNHGIGIAVLKNPVTFVQMGTDDETTEVKVVFVLAVKNPSTQIDTLQEILGIIQNKEVLKRIINAKDSAEILNIIKETEEAA